MADDDFLLNTGRLARSTPHRQYSGASMTSMRSSDRSYASDANSVFSSTKFPARGYSRPGTMSKTRPPRTSILDNSIRMDQGTTPARNVHFAPDTPFSASMQGNLHGNHDSPGRRGGPAWSTHSVASQHAHDAESDMFESPDHGFGGGTGVYGRGTPHPNTDRSALSTGASKYSQHSFHSTGSGISGITNPTLHSAFTGRSQANALEGGGGEEAGMWQQNLGLEATEELCKDWVVVSGFPAINDREAQLLRVFDDNGSVKAVKQSTSNWALVRFHSQREAHRAVQVHDGTLVNGAFIGVKLVTSQLARSMNLQFDAEGTDLHDTGAAGTAFLSQTLSSYNDNEGDLSVSTAGRSRGRERASGDANGRTQRGLSPHARRPFSPYGGGAAHDAPYAEDEASAAATGQAESEVDFKLPGDTWAQRGGGGAAALRRRSRFTAAGSEPAPPELYLQPVRRESVCELVMRFFGLA